MKTIAGLITRRRREYYDGSAHYDAPPPPHEDRYGPGSSGYTYGAP